jgi:drug/metabolite transporter (DMT)-like permease
MKIANEKNFWAGVLFIAFGAAFAIGSGNYDMGTAQRMGPAYFPKLLGVLLVLIGVFTSIDGLRKHAEDGKVDRFHFRPLLLVLGGVCAFGALLRPAGLVAALLAMVALAAYASHAFSIRQVVPLMLFLVVLVLAVFIWGLGLVIPVWPAFISR